MNIFLCGADFINILNILGLSKYYMLKLFCDDATCCPCCNINSSDINTALLVFVWLSWVTSKLPAKRINGDLKAQYVISATRGPSTKTEQRKY